MKRQRLASPYKAYALDADGKRTPIRAHGIVVELRPGIEVQIDFAQHPNFAGQLCMLTPPPHEMERTQAKGILDDFAVGFGGANVLHVWVERRVTDRVPPWEKPQSKKPRRGTP
jgi:hypothetical protein